MNIVNIVELEDGSKLATIADDEGNVVGTNVYSPESDPQPQIGPVPYPGMFSRIWSWFTSPDEPASSVEHNE